MTERKFGPVEIDVENAIAYLDAMKRDGHYWPHADAQLRALLSQPAPEPPSVSRGAISKQAAEILGDLAANHLHVAFTGDDCRTIAKGIAALLDAPSISQEKVRRLASMGGDYGERLLSAVAILSSEGIKIRKPKPGIQHRKSRNVRTSCKKARKTNIERKIDRAMGARESGHYYRVRPR